MRVIRLNCRTPTCAAFAMVHVDEYIPPDWTCPVCLDKEHEQRMEALAKDHGVYRFDRPIKRIADF